MAEQNTNVRNSLEKFEEVMNGVQFHSEEATEIHNLMLQSMKNLVQETDRFYKKTNGAYPKMTEESFDHFTALYQDVLNVGREYRKVMSGLGGMDKESGEIMNLIMDPIEELLEKDLHTLSSAKEKGLDTLPELVERARTKVVNIHGQQIDTAGANLSQRMKVTVPGKDGNVTGYFTENVSSDFETEYQELVGRAASKNPGIKKILSMMSEGDLEFLLDDVDSGKIPKFVANGYKPSPDVLGPKHEIEPDHALDDYVSVPAKKREAWNQLVEGTGLVQDFVFFAKELAVLKNKYAIFDHIEIENNNNVARRNSAMSSVADLLGMGNLIARSESMKLVDEYENENGEIVRGKSCQGTFMEPAKGRDLRNCISGDVITSMDVELDMENDEIKKQASDLQVLDFICGNVDRHGANLFYQIDNRDPNHPRLTGIQGIDNDCSFGGYKDNCMQLPSADGTVAISESTARTVLSLDETMLKTVLRQYRFSEKELEGAWARTQTLQDAIRDGYEFFKEHPEEKLSYKHVRIVGDSEWSQFSMKDLADTTRKSYFKTVSDVQNFGRGALIHTPFEQAEEKYLKNFGEYDRQGAEFHRLSSQLKKEDKGLLTGSRQYDQVMEQVKQLEHSHAESRKSPSIEGIQRTLEEYQKTLQTAQAYLEYKHNAFEEKIKGKSEKEQKKELEKYQDPTSRDFKRRAAVSELIGKLERFQKQAESLLASRAQYEEKKAIVEGGEKKQEEYLRKLEGERKKEQAGKEPAKRVLMSKEELFGGAADKQKSVPDRVREKEIKAPEKAFTQPSRSK